MITIVVRELGKPERTTTFDQSEVSIGRLLGSDVLLDDPRLARRHARVVRRLPDYLLIDHQSTTGTYVNGRRITGPVVLAETDRINAGPFELQVTPFMPARAVPLDADDARWLEAIAQPNAVDELRVYADWLETRAHHDRAAYVRRVLGSEERALATLPRTWRALVARPRIEGCERRECPRWWSLLPRGGDDLARRCLTCGRTVRFTAHDEAEIEP